MKKFLIIIWLLCPLVVSADTMTFYPTHDGTFYRNGVLETWSTIRGGAGTGSIIDTSSDSYLTYYDTSATQYGTLMRSGYVFDLSALPATSTIVSATMDIYGGTSFNTESCPDDKCGVSLISFTPIDWTSLSTSDFDISEYGTTRFSVDVGYSSWLGNHNVIDLNSSAVTYLQSRVGDFAGIGVMMPGDLDNVAPPTTNATSMQIGAFFVNFTGTDHDPVLTINYTLGGGGGGGGSGTTTATTTVSALTHSEELLVACVIIYFISYFGWGLIFGMGKQRL